MMIRILITEIIRTRGRRRRTTTRGTTRIRKLLLIIAITKKLIAIVIATKRTGIKLGRIIIRKQPLKIKINNLLGALLASCKTYPLFRVSPGLAAILLSF